ncbi:MAG: CoA pyrophosphatase [Anaerolineae bacterium]|nr:CoA pyrophosphatase [Anaerolineae bacterium]
MNRCNSSLTPADIACALVLDDFDVRAAWQRMFPLMESEVLPTGDSEHSKPAGVLLLLYPSRDGLTFPLTRRTDLVATHKGQISLPGGAQEEGETPCQAALRETCEELCACPKATCLLGALTPLHVAAGDFTIYPFVGYVPQRPDFKPNPVEVAEVLEVPLSLLLDEKVKALEHWHYHGIEMDVPFYRLQDQIVWGATAIILSEFEGRLRHSGLNVT